VGYQVISRVPSLLHTPLMGATNAISGISCGIAGRRRVGEQAGSATSSLHCRHLCAMINVVGGFVITDRMLKMFRRKPDAAK